MGAKLKRLKKPAATKTAAAANGKKKQQRGPKAYISAAGDESDAEGEEDQEAALTAALDAEDMVADGSDSDAADSENEMNGDEGSSSKKPAKSQPRDPDAANFLLKLDKKGISR